MTEYAIEPASHVRTDVGIVIKESSSMCIKRVGRSAVMYW